MPAKTATKEKNLLNAGEAERVSGPDAAANPQIAALQAAQEIEAGFQKLVQLLPGSQEMAAAAISALRMTVADGLAGMAGGQTGQPGQAIPPMSPPPGGGMPPPQM